MLTLFCNLCSTSDYDRSKYTCVFHLWKYRSWYSIIKNLGLSNHFVIYIHYLIFKLNSFLFLIKLFQPPYDNDICAIQMSECLSTLYILVRIHYVSNGPHSLWGRFTLSYLMIQEISRSFLWQLSARMSFASHLLVG